MDDLISRQAAIEAILALTTFERARELYEYVQEERLREREWIGGILDAIDAVICLPTAEPKTGRWIADGQKQKHGNEWMHCSVCGFSDIDVPATHTNYCPNCGAYMEGEET